MTMILATFVGRSGSPSVGCVLRDQGVVIDVQEAAKARSKSANPAYGSMLDLIDSGPAGLQSLRELTENAATVLVKHHQPLDKVRLLAPVPVPRQIREFSVFEQHIRDAPRASTRIKARMAGNPVPAQPADSPIPAAFRDQPVFYFCNRFNVIGPDTDVEWPSYSETHFDYELEVGVFLGKGGKNITKEKAKDHIFGYTLFNDFSARAQQWREMETRLGPSKGKSFDTGNAIGPWIVTADEIPDATKLQATVRVNGEVWAQNTTAGVLHSFPDMISSVSRDETLHAGEFFAAGTVGGCCGMEIDRWIKAGDIVELEVDKIGVLRNRIAHALPSL
jgi:2-keto-4-pentenoate hydratase/2-oxohepta-3-ene-1,7-dioic acid hydratase in catechol pathway